MFFEQFKLICSMRGTTPTSVIRKIGLSSGNVTSWKNGASPKKDILERLAQELDVPVSAFFEPGVPTKPQLQSDEEELLEVYRKLNQSGKRQLMGRAYELMDSQGSKQAGDEVTPPNFDLAASVLDRRVKNKVSNLDAGMDKWRKSMKALGNILKWASWVVLVASVICGIVFAQNAEDDALLVFLYWAIGGGLFFLFSIAQSYVLSVAICVKEKIDKYELERVKQSEKHMPPKKAYAGTSPVRPITHDGDSHITCPICGCTQISDMFCLECGIEFVRTNK